MANENPLAPIPWGEEEVEKAKRYLGKMCYTAQVPDVLLGVIANFSDMNCLNTFEINEKADKQLALLAAIAKSLEQQTAVLEDIRKVVSGE